MGTGGAGCSLAWWNEQRIGLTSVSLPLVMVMVVSGRVMKTLSREDTPSTPRSWVLAVILKNESR